ncbi:Duffy receptor precursor [Plasmodium gonderi]|uniref:Erythrocyte-binding protein n=1 Tax=Plasmodium gonderi TaxID=77519 RepID=A0A1Y1JNV8_PLAGO|nr:Duffy receptor precursor [Plasmodium gonderi]GAW84276.1 Duffy receptor precursor [Plasmodium gonderi]
MKGLNHTLYFLLVLFFSYKVNNVSLVETIENFLKLKNECVISENVYKQAKEHQSIGGNMLGLWLNVTNENRNKEKIKFKDRVTEIKIKYEQMFIKRDNRILKESDHDAQNFEHNSHKEEIDENNKTGDDKDCEHKSNGKIDNEKDRNNMVMVDNEIHTNDQHSVSVNNALGFVTCPQVGSCANSLKNGTTYGVHHKKTVPINIKNHDFLQYSIMTSCPKKRKRRYLDWDCPDRRDVCIPDRRYQLCMKEITNFINNTNTNFQSDIEFRKSYLKKSLIDDAKGEAMSLLEKYDYRYNEDLCSDLKSSWADFGDIIKGTDMEQVGYSIVVESNLKSLFRDNENNKLSREEFWNNTKKEVWDAMIIPIKNRSPRDNKWKCELNASLEVDPQIFRWIREWGIDYRSGLAVGRPRVKQLCERKTSNTIKKVCTVTECQQKCNSYERWKEKKKKHWDILSKKFKNVTNIEDMKKKKIETPYDLLKQVITEFNEGEFENQINKRDSEYIDLCFCDVEELRKKAQEQKLQNEKSASKSEVSNLGQGTQPVRNDKTINASGNSVDINVSNSTDGSQTNESVATEGQNGNNIPIQNDDQEKDAAETASEGSSEIENLGDLSEKDGSKDLDTSNSLTPEFTIDTNSPVDIKSASSTSANRDNNGSISIKEPIANPDLKGKYDTANGKESDIKVAGDSSENSDKTSSATGNTNDTPHHTFNNGTSEDKGEKTKGKESYKQDSSVNEGKDAIFRDNTHDETKRGDLSEYENKQSKGTLSPSDVGNLKNTESMDRTTDTSPSSAYKYFGNENSSDKNNGLNNDKLNINEYKHRDINTTREKIVLLSKVNKCSNNISLKYCNSVEHKIYSNSCSKDERKHLCCTISDFCLNYFVAYSYEYYSCLKKEFDDPLYKCFTKDSVSDKAYFAGGGILLIIILIIASTKMINNESEEATFNEFEDHCDNIHRFPLINNNIEHIQSSTPLDYF